jgi:hypothetical protein
VTAADKARSDLSVRRSVLREPLTLVGPDHRYDRPGKIERHRF